MFIITARKTNRYFILKNEFFHSHCKCVRVLVHVVVDGQLLPITHYIKRQLESYVGELFGHYLKMSLINKANAFTTKQQYVPKAASIRIPLGGGGWVGAARAFLGKIYFISHGKRIKLLFSQLTCK